MPAAMQGAASLDLSGLMRSLAWMGILLSLHPSSLWFKCIPCLVFLSLAAPFLHSSVTLGALTHALGSFSLHGLCWL